ncbi:MAG: transcription termination/antitermination protein NusA, partial [Helicobacter sp.]|nr:transcription termination/antitermination protein NusA [Helicobacter sp.]
MEKIMDIIELIACEKGLRTESVTEAVAEAMINTARKCIEETYSYGIDIDAKNKNFSLYQKILIVADDDERLQDGQQCYM